METKSTHTGVAVREVGKPEPLPLDYERKPMEWKPGVLTYTTGALVLLFFWLLWGDFAWSMRDRTVIPVFQLLLKNFQASDFQTSLFMIFLPALITMVLGPIISYKSDRHRGRWGRRIPFLLIPTPIAAGAMLGIAFAPAIGSWLHIKLGIHSPGLNQTTLILIGLMWTLFEVAAITTNSVFGAFVNDVVPRHVIGLFYGLFRAMSLLAGMAFNFFLMGIAEQYYMPIFIGVGALYLLGVVSMCLMVKEPQYPPVEPSQANAPLLTPLLATGRYFKDCFGKPYYYLVFLAVVVPNLAFMPINTFNLYFAKSVGLSMDMFGKLMTLYFAMSLVCTVPLGWLADKIHPLRLAMIALVLHGLAGLWGGLFAHDGWTFGVAFVATGFLSGMWYTATASLLPRLLPQSKFAQYASAVGIVGCLANMVFGPVIGKFLDLTHSYYPATYSMGFGFDVLALLVTAALWVMFQRLGGTQHYVAPE